MGLFRPSRDERGPDPYLDLKIILFLAGAGFGLAGALTNFPPLFLIGIAALVAGVAVRFLPRRSKGE